MVAASVVGATAANGVHDQINGVHDQNNVPAAYAVLDLRAINTPNVFKTLPSKTGDFDGGGPTTGGKKLQKRTARAGWSSRGDGI